MAPLRSLEREHPIIDSNFQSFCASHDILTVEEFIMYDFDLLASFAQKQPNCARLMEGINEVIAIIDREHVRPRMNGVDLLEDVRINKHVLSTGIEGLDLFLGGGLREGQLIEFVGPSSSGKTQVCLQFASAVVKKHSGTVVYIDTSNSFSPQRVEHFIRQTSDSAFQQAGNGFVQKIMSRILCHSVFDIFAMFDVLYQLEMSLRTQVHKEDCKVRLLIIDSISSLITPVLGGTGSQGHSMMTSAGILLKKLAHEHNIVVLVTNHMVAREGGYLKPALGESWKSIPHARLQLFRDRGSNICNISVLKHPSMAAGGTARFSIGH